MTKDYNRKHPRSKKNSRNASHLLSVLMAFVCGYITANVFDAESLSHWVSQTVSTLKKDKAPSTKIAQATPKAELPKPKFEFYTLLSKDHPGQINSKPTPNEHYLHDRSAHDLAKTIQVKVAEATALDPIQGGKKQNFDVQLASYNKMTDAERLKATLLMKDFNAHIQVIKRNDGQWYRVIIGPYTSMRDAEKAQLSIAHSEHLMGIIRRLEA